ncbi:MAG: hypothetical protein MHM6MM_000536 [Cercozoa sp. M6MM]
MHWVSAPFDTSFYSGRYRSAADHLPTAPDFVPKPQRTSYTPHNSPKHSLQRSQSHPLQFARQDYRLLEQKQQHQQQQQQQQQQPRPVKKADLRLDLSRVRPLSTGSADKTEAVKADRRSTKLIDSYLHHDEDEFHEEETESDLIQRRVETHHTSSELMQLEAATTEFLLSFAAIFNSWRHNRQLRGSRPAANIAVRSIEDLKQPAPLPHELMLLASTLSAEWNDLFAFAVGEVKRGAETSTLISHCESQYTELETATKWIEAQLRNEAMFPRFQAAFRDERLPTPRERLDTYLQQSQEPKFQRFMRVRQIGTTGQTGQQVDVSQCPGVESVSTSKITTETTPQPRRRAMTATTTQAAQSAAPARVLLPTRYPTSAYAMCT